VLCVKALFCLTILACTTLFSSTGQEWEKAWALSKLPSVPLPALEKGEIAIGRRPVPRVPDAMVVESVFYLALPPKKAAEAMESWDPSKHKTLGIKLHEQDPQTLIASLKKIPEGKGIEARSRGLATDALPFQLSKAEAAAAQSLAGKAPFGALEKILANRMLLFDTRGADGLPAYENTSRAWQAGTSVRHCLQASPEVARHFHDLLLQGLKGEGSARRTAYAELLTVRREPTLLLGCYLSASAAEGWQIIDFQHYVSGGFYASVVCSQLWPTDKGSVVWRVDHVFVPNDYNRKGIAAMAGDKLLAQEIKAAIGFLQQDCR
jgi:hypothetical protein